MGYTVKANAYLTKVLKNHGFTVRTEGVHSGTAVHTMPEETDAVAAEISRLGYTVVSRNQSRLIIK